MKKLILIMLLYPLFSFCNSNLITSLTFSYVPQNIYHNFVFKNDKEFSFWTKEKIEKECKQINVIDVFKEKEKEYITYLNVLIPYKCPKRNVQLLK